MRCAVFFLTLLFWPLALRAAPPEPPALLPCTPTACVRDPAQLETFVTGFYRWYIQQKDIASSRSQGNDFPKNCDKVIKKLASQTFFNNWKIAWYHEDLAPDPILLAQDSEDDWAYTIAAKTSDIGEKVAYMIVPFPVPLYMRNDTTDPAYTLHVELQSIRNYWRIHKITRAD